MPVQTRARPRESKRPRLAKLVFEPLRHSSRNGLVKQQAHSLCGRYSVARVLRRGGELWPPKDKHGKRQRVWWAYRHIGRDQVPLVSPSGEHCYRTRRAAEEACRRYQRKWGRL